MTARSSIRACSEVNRSSSCSFRDSAEVTCWPIAGSSHKLGALASLESSTMWRGSVQHQIRPRSIHRYVEDLRFLRDSQYEPWLFKDTRKEWLRHNLLFKSGSSRAFGRDLNSGGN